MGKVHVISTFSLYTIREIPEHQPIFRIANISVYKIHKEEFCTTLKKAEEDGTLISEIGHESTVNLVNVLCGLGLKKNRIEIKLDEGDEAYVVIFSLRLEEGKVFSFEDIEQMYEEGKVCFYKIVTGDKDED